MDRATFAVARAIGRSVTPSEVAATCERFNVRGDAAEVARKQAEQTAAVRRIVSLAADPVDVPGEVSDEELARRARAPVELVARIRAAKTTKIAKRRAEREALLTSIERDIAQGRRLTGPKLKLALSVKLLPREAGKVRPP